MIYDENAVLECIVELFWQQHKKKRESIDFEKLDEQFRELAQNSALDPKEAAQRVKMFLAKKATQRRSFSFWEYTGLIVISVVLSTVLSLFVVPYLYDTATITPSVLNRLEVLSAIPQTLPADGKTEIPITVAVFDQYSQTVAGQTYVEFAIYPPNSGIVTPKRVPVNSEGKAETLFRTGNITGEVQIIASVAPYPQKVVNITLEEVAQPNLILNLVSEQNYQVVHEQVITLTFLIENNGNAIAEEIEFLIEIPDSIMVHRMTSGENVVIDTNSVTWQIENLEPRANAERNLVVTVSSNLAEGNNELKLDYEVHYKNHLNLTGQETIYMNISELVPNALELSIDPVELPANGIATAFVTAKVLDQYGNPMNSKTSVTFTWQLPDTEEILTDTITATFDGAILPFTGTIPGNVVFVAKTDMYSDTATLYLYKTATVSIQTHLYPGVGITNPLIIYQLPMGTSVNLLGTVQSSYQKVSLAIWVPKDVISTTQNDQYFISEGYREIYIGETLDALQETNSQLYNGAVDLPVQMLNNTREDYVRVQIEGWTIAEYLE